MSRIGRIIPLLLGWRVCGVSSTVQHHLYRAQVISLAHRCRNFCNFDPRLYLRDDTNITGPASRPTDQVDQPTHGIISSPLMTQGGPPCKQQNCAQGGPPFASYLLPRAVRPPTSKTVCRADRPVHHMSYTGRSALHNQISAEGGLSEYTNNRIRI